MFDIGFWEIALIGVIALLVVGPERLPAVARSVGLWVGRIRRYVSHVKQDIERELHADEVRELLERGDNSIADIREVAEETASVLKDARSELDDAARATKDVEAIADRNVPDVNASNETAAPRIAHHAVDEDLFSPSNLSSVTPGAEATSEPDTTSDADTDSDNEQHTDRQGQR